VAQNEPENGTKRTVSTSAAQHYKVAQFAQKSQAQ